MKIEIKLEDTDSCRGCPLMHLDDMETPYCGIDYVLVFGKYYDRPQECIDDNGE